MKQYVKPTLVYSTNYANRTWYWCENRCLADYNGTLTLRNAIADEVVVLAKLLGLNYVEPEVCKLLPQQAKNFIQQMREQLPFTVYKEAVKAINIAFLTRKTPSFYLYTRIWGQGKHDVVKKELDLDIEYREHYRDAWKICCGSGTTTTYVYDSFWRRSLKRIVIHNEVLIATS